jgi:hypothetical protein
MRYARRTACCSCCIALNTALQRRQTSIADSYYYHCTAHCILYKQDESGLKCVITGYDPHGFDFGEVNARGSIIAFPTSYVLWSPT